ncbi:MAG: citramalate synthase [bacterium]
MNKIEIFDSTLRDGAQGEGISFSVEDKLKIVKSLDDLGISYIEAGNPGSNPKDLEFFEQVKKINLVNARLTAFGSTRRRDIATEEDKNVQSLLIADTPAVAIFGKCWDFHVTDVIKTTLEENLRMIKDTIAFFKKRGKEVIFDAEHFFDGYKANPEYAFKALEAAVAGGADCLALCETNGGALPNEVYKITKKVIENFSVKIGIHCHNDGGLAVANSIMAVEAGATQVQGTYLGFGERTGNANLAIIIPNLQLKKSLSCIPEEKMAELTSTAKYIAEVSNIIIENKEPYIGKSSFAHKGGMHIDAVSKAPQSFEHINPEIVGNERRFLMSEVSGRSTILKHIQEVDPTISKDSPEAQEIIDMLKQLEYDGYQFEGAESSFELLIHKKLGIYKPFFELDHYKIIEESCSEDKELNSSVIIKIIVDKREEITAAEGNGPVNALDKALRKALEVFYPDLKKVHLTDYKVRVLDSQADTASKVRVLIESSDGYNNWTTIGVSTDLIKASWIALVDSLEYKLLKDLKQAGQVCVKIGEK